ncbi:MAG: indole-3-glycerol phosphate synthase TrpC [Vicinamibacteria bacterium]|jgi:indole-3-glycerol phosphate synthase|nr:indole-3-glycerol phosphate synthase TrpC [Vicinamibacteria bacterium]
MTSATVLDRILVRTRERVRARQEREDLARVMASAKATPDARGLARKLSQRRHQVNIIAEFKRRSPSRGAIRADGDPALIAREYDSAGAAAMSVLTDEDFFGGSLADLAAARTAVSLPILRKDFVIDAYQIWEAKRAQADAVLLIVAALSHENLRALFAEAKRAGLDALVEVHDRAELDTALALGARLIGVNNRNLKTLAVSLDTSLRLITAIPDETVAVAESGLHSADDIRRLRDAGFDAFLIGEHFMSAPRPGEALATLLREVR